MVFMVLAGFVLALVASRYISNGDYRVSSNMTRSRFSR
jgi:hypothetical protein